MKRPVAKMRASCAGFTLIEALVATALMGLVLAALATLTAQWLPNWDRGIMRVQRTESLGIALDRLVADIAASQFIFPNRESKKPIFDGTELGVTFVRTSLGPNTRSGLDVVRIAETADNRGRVLVRSRAAFVPFAIGAESLSQLTFSDPVALVRAPYRISFAYAGRDGTFRNIWQNADDLPSMVRLLVSDMATERTLSVSTATMVHVEAPANVVCNGADGACDAPAQVQQNSNNDNDDGSASGSSRPSRGR